MAHFFKELIEFRILVCLVDFLSGGAVALFQTGGTIDMNLLPIQQSL
jgi:hypothetical protein